MGAGLITRISRWLTHWLTREKPRVADSPVLLNFERLSYEIRPGDVILVEGRSKVSEVIKLISQSPWTHAALYIGRLYEIEDPELRSRISQHTEAAPDQQLIIETLLGEGTVVYPLDKYREEHVRLCRPSGISPRDAQQVIAYAADRLGTDYDVRQLLDLARFMFPYGYLPRRWRSSLFSHNAGNPTRTVCSTMLAQAFQSIHFPLLPFAEHTENDKIHIYQRNPRLVTPRDFDYSPYFDIIKYPLFGLDDIAVYRHLPWGDKDIVCNDINDCFRELPHQIETDQAQAASSEPDQITPAAANGGFPQSLNLLRSIRSIKGETS
jgi:hypothetical protein